MLTTCYVLLATKKTLTKKSQLLVDFKLPKTYFKCLLIVDTFLSGIFNSF
jgi:hypothetical protein